MDQPSLFVTRNLPAPVMETIRQRFRLTCEPFDTPPSAARLRDGVREADAMLCTVTERIDQALLSEAPRLRVIANYAVGFNNIDLAAARRRGITVTNTPDVLTEATADLTWALLLATSRRLVEGDRLVRTGQWTGWSPTQLLGTDLHGRRLGIIGMGRIGQAVARRAMGFSLSVWYTTRSPLPRRPETASWSSRDLTALLAESDVISLHVPLTPETTHLLNRAAFQTMKQGVIIINTSRGPLIEETALLEALDEGRLGGVGLDVYEREPLVAPRLLDFPHVVTLPHIGSATTRTRIAMGMRCLENIQAVLEGRLAPNQVV